VTVYDVAVRLPSINVLRQRCQVLAMLDSITGGGYYTYTRARDSGSAASMCDGSGEYDIVFTPVGSAWGGRGA
jgi:hypothetical protein